MRWSCQRAVCPDEIFFHSGVAVGDVSTPTGTVLPRRVRLMYVACECRFSNTPLGPMRRYGSASYPSTVISVARAVRQLELGAEVDDPGADTRAPRA